MIFQKIFRQKGGDWDAQLGGEGACPPMLAEGHFLPPPQYFEVGGQNFGGEAPKFRRRRRRFRKILGKFSKNCCLKMQ